MLLFNLAQLAQQAIVFGVRHLRIVQHEVTVVVALDLGAQLPNPLDEPWR